MQWSVHNAKKRELHSVRILDFSRLPSTKHQVPMVQRVDNAAIISIQYMQVTELQVSLILVNWHVLDGTSYLLKNWFYVYKCHLKHSAIVTAFYNKVSMLITPATFAILKQSNIMKRES